MLSFLKDNILNSRVDIISYKRRKRERKKFTAEDNKVDSNILWKAQSDITFDCRRQNKKIQLGKEKIVTSGGCELQKEIIH